MSTFSRLCISAVIALAGALLCYTSLVTFNLGAGDFSWALHAARDLLNGRDPYAYPFGPLAIPYPLPSAFIGVLFAWLPDALAGALFTGLSTGVVVWLVLRTEPVWRLLMFVSWSFCYGLLFAQWIPLLLWSWFLPSL